MDATVDYGYEGDVDEEDFNERRPVRDDSDSDSKSESEEDINERSVTWEYYSSILSIHITHQYYWQHGMVHTMLIHSSNQDVSRIWFNVQHEIDKPLSRSAGAITRSVNRILIWERGKQWKTLEGVLQCRPVNPRRAMHLSYSTTEAVEICLRHSELILDEAFLSMPEVLQEKQTMNFIVASATIR